MQCHGRLSSKNLKLSPSKANLNHLKNCIYFQEKIGSQEEVDAIINLTDDENKEIIRNKRLRIDSDSGKIGEKRF